MILTNEQAIDLVGRPFRGVLHTGTITGLRTSRTDEGEVVDGVTVTYPDGTCQWVDLDELYEEED